MNSWSARRRRIIFLFVLLSLVVLVGTPLFFFFHKTPTCSDGIQNGDESGRDCGGSCQLLCKAESLPIIIKGDPRILQIATSTFEVVGSFQNPNLSARISRAHYTIKLYSTGNQVPLKVIQGTAYIPKGQDFAVFEGPFEFEQSMPTRSTFEWTPESLIWEKDLSNVPELTIKEGILTDPGIAPKLDAEVSNPTLDPVSNIELTALLFDANGNIVGASKTLVERLAPGESAPLLFTWPRPFIASSTAVVILPRVLPDTSYIH